MLSQKLCQLLHWGISSYINGRIVEHTATDSNSHLLKHKIENGHKPLEYQTKLTILEKKRDYDQIFDTTMFNKSLRFALITRAFSKLL